MSSRASRKLYVGNLPGDIREREVEDLFDEFGDIVRIDLKISPRPRGHCFIEFEDARGAEDAIRDAIRGRDGHSIDGNRLLVELARGGRGQSSTNAGDSSHASQTLYVGNLPGDIRKREVQRLFVKFGRIVDIDLKIPHRPPGHCFIEFKDARDAEDAIRGRDGYNFEGNHLRVNLARSVRGQSSTNDGDSSHAGQTLYVGNLPRDITKREVDGLFYKFGHIVIGDLQIPRRGPGHCFIQFEDARDAEDAIRGRDGYNFYDYRLQVKRDHGGRGQSLTNDGDSSDDSAGGGGSGGVYLVTYSHESVGSSLTPRDNSAGGGRSRGVYQGSEYRFTHPQSSVGSSPTPPTKSPMSPINDLD